MNFNLLTDKIKYAMPRGRVQSSYISGYPAPVRFGDFFISDLVGSVANILNKPTCLMSGFELPAPCGSRKFKDGHKKMNITIYNFNKNQIRTTVIDNEPWFVLKDCANALGIKNANTSVKLSEKGVGKTYIPTKGGRQEVIIINEPNLYRLIFRSNKPQAQAFADWVYSEVLPSIRKNGFYNISPDLINWCAEVQALAIENRVREMCEERFNSVKKAVDDVLERELDYKHAKITGFIKTEVNKLFKENKQ